MSRAGKIDDYKQPWNCLIEKLTNNFKPDHARLKAEIRVREHKH